MLRFVSMLLMVCVGACAPVVTHGPRVQAGVTAMVTTGASRAPCDSACELDLTPQVALGAVRGWEASETRPGFTVGGNLSLFSSDLDVYVQAPTGWTGTLQAGAGALAGFAHMMPYVQLGRMRGDGSGWYTTQGFAWIFRRDARPGLIDDGSDDEAPGPDLVRPRYWAPTLAYRAPGTTGISVYVSGAFGTAEAWRFDVEGDPRPAGRETIRHLMLGMVLDTRRVDAAPAPGTTRR